jgi:hypothetical protein
VGWFSYQQFSTFPAFAAVFAEEVGDFGIADQDDLI